MSDNNNTQRVNIRGGGALSIGASNSISSKRQSRRRSVQLENPDQNEVLKNITKNEDMHEARQAPLPSSKKTAERKKKRDTPTETSTSTRKRSKTSSKKKEGSASSSGVAKNIAPQKATVLNESKIKGNPKPKRKSNKKVANANNKKGEATPTYKPRDFIGLYVYKEHNGAKSLGTVVSYDYNEKLFKIGYDDERTEYMEQSEVLKHMANAKDIMEAQQALRNNLKKEQEGTLGEASTTAGGKEEGPSVASEASNK